MNMNSANSTDRWYCVVSHTHWDREWYQPFDIFRWKLVDLIDRLLDTVSRYPQYIFHLDAQTIVLEDYLEVRPQRRELLKACITAGSIVVGPWYLQNDFYLTSGEATIRNLLEGHRLAAEFGACAKVGYAPDQFGNISQLPQILQNFGIDNFIFGRGFSRFVQQEDGQVTQEKLPSEFFWRGADGTRALAIHMKHWYNNAQRFSADLNKARQLVKRVEDSFEGIAVTPYLLLMNGVDHLEAQDDLLPILQRLNDSGLNGRIQQVRMEDYVRQVQAYIQDEKVPMMEHTGELRMGGDWELLKGTLSSRHHLKVANVRAQNRLECRLEPLYAMLEASGCHGVYSVDHFRYMWKKLLQNHPHDSICGCSRDEIHQHMEDNYTRLEESGDEMLKRGLQVAAYHNPVAAQYPQGYSLTVVNTIDLPMGGVIEAELLFPADDQVGSFAIYDEQGHEVEYALLSRETKPHDVFSPINLPGVITVDCCRVYLFVPSVAPLTFAGYSVRKTNAAPAQPLQRLADQLPELESDRWKVTIAPTGAVTVLDKKSGQTFEDCLGWEDTADKGDAYVYHPTEEPAILSGAFVPQITVLEKNDYVQRCELHWAVSLPEAYDFENECRSSRQTVTTITLTLTVRKGQEYIEVGYRVNNTAKDHRLRLLVRGIRGGKNVFLTDIPFDVIEQSGTMAHPKTLSPVVASTSFAALEQSGQGFGVFTEGAHECEQAENHVLAFTILRATGVISRSEDMKVVGGDQWRCPGNQCLRTLEGRIGLFPYTGDREQIRLLHRAKAFRNALLYCFVPCDKKRFTGGRPAVQDTSLAELFYLPDPFEAVLLPNNRPLLSVSGRTIWVSAFKMAENGQGLVVRLFHYGTAPEEVTVRIRGMIYCSDMAEKSRRLLGTDAVTLSMQPKKIVTLFIDHRGNTLEGATTV